MRRRISTWLVAVVALALVAVAPAAGTHQSSLQQSAQQAQAQTLAGNPNFKVIGDEVADSPAEIHGMRGMQHGQPGDHLPGSSENVTLLGQVDIEGAAPDRVADVTAYGNYAYLSVHDPEGCYDAGFAVIDISDPTDPRAGRLHRLDRTDRSRVRAPTSST